MFSFPTSKRANKIIPSIIYSIIKRELDLKSKEPILNLNLSFVSELAMGKSLKFSEAQLIFHLLKN